MVKFLSLQWHTATLSVLTVHLESNSFEKTYDFSEKLKTSEKPQDILS